MELPGGSSAVRRRGHTGAAATVGARRRRGAGGAAVAEADERARRRPDVALGDDPLTLLQTKGGRRSARSIQRSARMCSTRSVRRRSWSSRRSPPTQFAGIGDLDLLYGGTDALNRAMAAFCGDDPRLLAVGVGAVGRCRRGPSRPHGERSRRAARRSRSRPTFRAASSRPSHPDHDRAVGAAGRGERPRRQPHRRRGPSGAARLPRQRAAGHRLPRRRGERPLEGLPGHPSAARGVLGGAVLDGMFDRSPACVGRRSRRERCGSSRGSAASTWPCASPAPSRRSVTCATSRASTSTATSASPRSRASRSGG